jgi:hypothetical protein
MKETITDLEVSPQRHRLEYAPVPLDPWHAIDYDGPEGYVVSSFERITRKLEMAVTSAIKDGWVESPELAVKLYKLMEVSLYDSQRYRVDLNTAASHDEVLSGTDPRIIYAKNGVATPLESFSLLMDYPEMGSIEIAKLSHPLDSLATTDMDQNVNDATEKQFGGFHPEGAELARYKTKTSHRDIPAVTVLRKQILASCETQDGLIQIVQRKAFLVRGDDEAKIANDAYLDRIVKNEGRHLEELYPKIESYLAHADKLQDVMRDLKWLQPLSTSYYFKNATVLKARKSAQQ